MRMSTSAFLSGLLALALTCVSGCLDFPAASPCTSDDDCGTGERCEVGGGRCVPGAADDAAGPGAGDRPRPADARPTDVRSTDARADAQSPADAGPPGEAGRSDDAAGPPTMDAQPDVDAGPVVPPWLSVAAGQHHTCAIDAVGRLYCWGDDRKGQLGSQAPDDRSGTPLRVELDAPGRFTQVSCGLMHTCALYRPDAGGGDQLWCWGLDANGQLGDGPIGDLPPNEMTAHPVRVEGEGWTQVSAGGTHTCGLRDGGLWCWGSNLHGQLGLPCPEAGGPLEMKTPQLVAGDWSFVATSRNTHYHQHTPNGHDFTCALARADGALSCWGANDYGQLTGTPTGCESAPLSVGGGHAFESLGLGSYFGCGLSAGEIWCWGANSHSDQLGNGGNGENGGSGAGLATVVSDRGGWTGLTVGSEHSCAWMPGRARCWGSASDGELGAGSFTSRWLELSAGAQPWAAFAAGSGHTCSLAEGALACFGDRGDGQIGDDRISDSFVPQRVRLMDEPVEPAAGVPAAECPRPETGWTAVALAPAAACGLYDRELYCWGRNDAGQLPGLPVAPVIPAPTATGFAGPFRTLAAGGTPVDGNVTVCTTDDACEGRCWASVDVAHLADVPSVPEDGLGWRSFSVGNNHVCGLRAPCGSEPDVPGDIWCWGDGELGQLGALGQPNPPVAVVVDPREGPPGGWLRLAVAANRGCAIDERHALWCWGEGRALGRVGVDSDWTEISTATGGVDVCGLRQAGQEVGGRLYCWVPWSQGPEQPFAPPPEAPYLTGVRSVSIANRGSHICTVMGDCSARCFGYNHFGQLGNGTWQLEGNGWLEAAQAARPTGGGAWAVVEAYADDTDIRGTSCGLRLDGTLWCWGFNGRGALGNGLGPAIEPVRIMGSASAR